MLSSDLKAVRSTVAAVLRTRKRICVALWRARLKPSRFAGLLLLLFGFSEINSCMLQEVFEAEKRCNAIEDETRRIQLAASELLRACHDEKACQAFHAPYFCYSSNISVRLLFPTNLGALNKPFQSTLTISLAQSQQSKQSHTTRQQSLWQCMPKHMSPTIHARTSMKNLRE